MNLNKMNLTTPLTEMDNVHDILSIHRVHVSKYTQGGSLVTSNNLSGKHDSIFLNSAARLVWKKCMSNYYFINFLLKS